MMALINANECKITLECVVLCKIKTVNAQTWERNSELPIRFILTITNSTKTPFIKNVRPFF